MARFDTSHYTSSQHVCLAQFLRYYHCLPPWEVIGFNRKVRIKGHVCFPIRVHRLQLIRVIFLKDGTQTSEFTTVKVTFRVIQDHWHWCHLIGHIWLVFHYKYSVSPKKWTSFYFLNNSVKNKPIWIYFLVHRILKKFYMSVFEPVHHTWKMSLLYLVKLSLIHIWRCRRIERCRSRWSPYH